MIKVLFLGPASCHLLHLLFLFLLHCPFLQRAFGQVLLLFQLYKLLFFLSRKKNILIKCHSPVILQLFLQSLSLKIKISPFLWESEVLERRTAFSYTLIGLALSFVQITSQVFLCANLAKISCGSFFLDANLELILYILSVSEKSPWILKYCWINCLKSPSRSVFPKNFWEKTKLDA